MKYPPQKNAAGIKLLLSTIARQGMVPGHKCIAERKRAEERISEIKIREKNSGFEKGIDFCCSIVRELSLRAFYKYLCRIKRYMCVLYCFRSEQGFNP